MTTSGFLLVPGIVRVLLSVLGLVVVGLRGRGVPRGLGMAGCALLALSGLTSVGYALAVPALSGAGSVQESFASLGLLSAMGSFFQLLGIVLLIVALCVRPNPTGGVPDGFPRPPQPYVAPGPPPPAGPRG